MLDGLRDSCVVIFCRLQQCILFICFLVFLQFCIRITYYVEQLFGQLHSYKVFKSFHSLFLYILYTWFDTDFLSDGSIRNFIAYGVICDFSNTAHFICLNFLCLNLI
jgi:hypothetical protein